MTVRILQCARMLLQLLRIRPLILWRQPVAALMVAISWMERLAGALLQLLMLWFHGGDAHNNGLCLCHVSIGEADSRLCLEGVSSNSLQCFQMQLLW